MRYALVSDLHANLQAWNAIWMDIHSLGVDRTVCLGDIVGYGPNPAEVLREVHSYVDHVCLGNHDAALCGKLSSSLFNDNAQACIRWTRRQLGDAAVKYMRTLPLTLKGEGFRCAHGDFACPAAFNYLWTETDAMRSLQTVAEPLLFVGHTHDPGVFGVAPGAPLACYPPGKLAIEPEARYVINVGSVGQPRGGDARACFCLYDDEEHTVVWRRIPFDLDAYRAALERSGLPAEPSAFLHFDPRSKATPVRELVNFSPASSPSEAATDTVSVVDVERLRRTASVWRRSFLAIFLLLVLGGGFGGYAWWRHATTGQTLHPPFLPVASALNQPIGANLVSMPTEATLPGQPVPRWIVRMDNRRAQAVWCEARAGGGVEIVLTSSDIRSRVTIRSGQINVDSDHRLQLDVDFLRADDFTGEVTVALDAIREHDRIDGFVNRLPRRRGQDNWIKAQQTFDLPAGTRAVVMTIGGYFEGTVRVRNISLVRRE